MSEVEGGRTNQRKPDSHIDDPESVLLWTPTGRSVSATSGRNGRISQVR